MLDPAPFSSYAQILASVETKTTLPFVNVLRSKSLCSPSLHIQDSVLTNVWCTVGDEEHAGKLDLVVGRKKEGSWPRDRFFVSMSTQKA